MGLKKIKAHGREMTEIELKGLRTGLDKKNKVETGPEEGRSMKLKGLS